MTETTTLSRPSQGPQERQTPGRALASHGRHLTALAVPCCISAAVLCSTTHTCCPAIWCALVDKRGMILHKLESACQPSSPFMPARPSARQALLSPAPIGAHRFEYPPQVSSKRVRAVGNLCIQANKHKAHQSMVPAGTVQCCLSSFSNIRCASWDDPYCIGQTEAVARLGVPERVFDTSCSKVCKARHETGLCAAHLHQSSHHDVAVITHK